MAYLTNFDYDLFLSYSHVDDLVTGGKKGGWITRFYEHLEVTLWQRLGGKGSVKIWWDPQLAANQVFDQTIKNAINRSALFIAFTSEGYLKSNYCQQELNWFYQKAKNEPAGLAIGDRRRIFNLLLNNIPYTRWLPEFTGAGAYTFHDAQRDEDVGFPISASEVVFRQQLHALVDQIDKTINALKEQDHVTVDGGVSYGKPYEKPKTVFMAATSDGLRRTHERVCNELQDKGVNVIANIPPPFEAKPHEEKVISDLSNVNLAVHLLDGFPGFPVYQDPNKNTYPRKQTELSLVHAKRQLIWLPRAQDMPNIEDHDYETFLTGLENNKQGRDSYKFIQELQTPTSITSTIIEELNREVSDPAPAPSAALLDTHFKDQPFAWELYQFLIDKKIRSYINPEEDDPTKNLNIFQELLKQVSLLIIIFGHVNGDWVRERLGTALQLAITEGCPLKACGVYMPSSVKERSGGVNPKQFPPTCPIIFFDNFSSLTPLVDSL